jgi:hypothetical protein
MSLKNSNGSYTSTPPICLHGMDGNIILYFTLLLGLFIFYDYCKLFIYIAHRSCLKKQIVRNNRRHTPAENASRTRDVGNEEETL